jgi:hypothetical protein
MSDNPEAVAKFDAAATRFARAVAPLIAREIRYQESQGEEPMEASVSLNLTLASVVTRFATADGAVSGVEARAYERVAGIEASVISDLVASAGVLRDGPIMDLFVRMGDATNFESSIRSSIQLLHTIHGMDAVKEYVLSLRALAAATCGLDGKSEAESEALAKLDEFLKAALAELG